MGLWRAHAVFKSFTQSCYASRTFGLKFPETWPSVSMITLLSGVGAWAVARSTGSPAGSAVVSIFYKFITGQRGGGYFINLPLHDPREGEYFINLP